jgi:hypothetical protein
VKYTQKSLFLKKIFALLAEILFLMGVDGIEGWKRHDFAPIKSH